LGGEERDRGEKTKRAEGKNAIREVDQKASGVRAKELEEETKSVDAPKSR